MELGALETVYMSGLESFERNTLPLNPSHGSLCIQTPSPPLQGMDFDDLGIPDVRVRVMRDV